MRAAILVAVVTVAGLAIAGCNSGGGSGTKKAAGTGSGAGAGAGTGGTGTGTGTGTGGGSSVGLPGGGGTGGSGAGGGSGGGTGAGTGPGSGSGSGTGTGTGTGGGTGGTGGGGSGSGGTGGGSGSGTGGGCGTGPGGAGPGGGGSGGGTGAGTGTGGGGGPIYYAEDLEGAMPGFQLAYPGNSAFVVGTPTFGPGAAHGGARCLAVTLSSNYPNNLFAVAATPLIDLAGAQEPVLSFYHAYDIEPNTDGARIYVRTAAGSFTVIEPFRGYSRALIEQTLDAGFSGLSGSVSTTGSGTGNSGAVAPRPIWVEDRFDLSPFAGQSGLQILFDFETNAYNASGIYHAEFAGWFVDDIVVGEAASIGAVSAPFQPQPVIEEDFEGALLFTPVASGSSFEIGSLPAGVGPGAALSGSKCAGTNIAHFLAPGPADTQGRYANDIGTGSPAGPDRLRTSAPLALPSGSTEAVLVFSHFFDLENRYDGVRVAVAPSASGPWTTLHARDGYPGNAAAFMRYVSTAAQCYTGFTTSWKRASVDLTPAIASLGTSFFVAFELATDSSNFQKYDGWFVDDVAVFAR